MRHLLLLTLGLGLPAACLSQPADSLISMGRADLRAGQNLADLDRMMAARATFERATADAGREAWARYYAALADFRIANYLLGREEGAKDRASAHLESAVENLKPLIDRDEQSAEACALLSSVYGRQIALSPLKAMFLGPRSGRAMEKAERLAPDNPRVVLAAAMSDFNTPKMWGGDKERAMEGFRKAAALFAEQKPAGPLHPVWGTRRGPRLDRPGPTSTGTSARRRRPPSRRPWRSSPTSAGSATPCCRGVEEATE